MTRVEFIEKISDCVVRIAPEFGILACSAVIAQACLESNYGKSDKASYHNYFGLKYRDNRVSCHNGTFVSESYEQDELGNTIPIVDTWYSFDSMENGVRGYFEFISCSNYSNLIGVSDPYKYLELIKEDKYCTSTNYVENVYNTLVLNRLQIYDTVNRKERFNMKYSNTRKPLECIMTNSSCYRGTKEMSIKGVLLHSTGANNKSLKRYVQPLQGEKDYDKLISILGVNTNKNDYNHANLSSGLNAFIGASADGTVLSVQTLPWYFRPWGCGSGKYGSCNDGWIQFEICEDSLNDRDYFLSVYNEAVELVAYLCSKFNLNPIGSILVNGVSIPVITCHCEAHSLGFASNHADVLHWFSRYNKSMDTFRDDVSNKLSQGSIVSSDGATSSPSSSGVLPKDDNLYRVRLSWTDKTSQTGAYKDLSNAIKSCKQGYKVFDNNGNVVYDSITSSELTNTVHIVSKGDTLYSISKKYNVSISSIIKLNSIKDANKITVGQELRIK